MTELGFALISFEDADGKRVQQAGRSFIFGLGFGN